MKKVSYFCPACHKEFSVDYDGWKPSRPCPTCSTIARMTSLLPKSGKVSSISFKRYSKQPTAIWNTPKGPMATDDKGNVIDMRDTRYDLDNDPHGWEASGEKVKGKQRR